MPRTPIPIVPASSACHLGTNTSLLLNMWLHKYREAVRAKCQTVVMVGTPPDASQVPVQAVMLP
ncbi:hypothetical protein BN444_04255 [Xanthomonas translucens pv. translucens DSM 18974]|uniref:Uncharacterized protein n=1 Tax=Xanthomonas translucens pv. translucens DSM 18974 TaxID=1261556 RepID=A0A1C3TLF1_XANCT|nr:hypothetical protein BN444_04255 [Xanthomonas translucens pv. translucens DSM 18974]